MGGERDGVHSIGGAERVFRAKARILASAQRRWSLNGHGSCSRRRFGRLAAGFYRLWHGNWPCSRGCPVSVRAFTRKNAPGSRIAPAGRAHRAVNPAQLWNGKSCFAARDAGSGYRDTINMDIHSDIDRMLIAMAYANGVDCDIDIF